jgi:actin-related protein
MEEVKILVIDIGSDSIKAGFAGASEPKVIIPSVVTKKDGTLIYPIRKGIVSDIVNNKDAMKDAMIKLLKKTFTELNINASENLVLLTDSPLTKFPPDTAEYDKSTKSRDMIIEIMFDHFGVPGLYFASQPVLDLYACGKVTGLVVNSGATCTNITPVYGGEVVSCLGKNEFGQVISYSNQSLDIGGRDLTTYLMMLLNQSKNSFKFNQRQIPIVNDIKEKLCFVADDNGSMLKDKTVEPYSFTGPNGKISVNVGKERFECPESLFRPQVFNIGQPLGIHTAVNNSIITCDRSIHNELYSNIVLSGGNTLFKYTEDRMKKEIESLAGKGYNVEVIPCYDKYRTWMGGSKLAESGTIKGDKWITKVTYDNKTSEPLYTKMIN